MPNTSIFPLLALTIVLTITGYLSSCTKSHIAGENTQKDIVWIDPSSENSSTDPHEAMNIYLSPTKNHTRFVVVACNETNEKNFCFQPKNSQGEPLHFVLANEHQSEEFRKHLDQSKKLFSPTSANGYALSNAAAITAAPSLVQVASQALPRSLNTLTSRWAKITTLAVMGGLTVVGKFLHQKSHGVFMPADTTMPFDTGVAAPADQSQKHREILERAYTAPSDGRSLRKPSGDPKKKEPKDVPPLIPLKAPDQDTHPNTEATASTEAKHLGKEECVDILYPKTPNPNKSVPFLAANTLTQETTHLPDLAQCDILLHPESISQHDIKRRREEFYTNKDANEERDRQCLDILYPSKFATDNEKKKGSFAPNIPKHLTDPHVVSYCHKHLEHSPNQDLIELHTTSHHVTHNPPMKMRDIDEDTNLGASSASTTSQSTPHAHQSYRAFSFEEYCKEVVYRFQGQDLSQEESEHLSVCQTFLSHIKLVSKYVVDHPISKEALEHSSWYRAKLQDNLRKRVSKKVIGQDHKQSPATLNELQDVMLFRMQRIQELKNTENPDDSPNLSAQIADASQIQHYLSRLIEVEAEMKAGTLSDYVDSMEPLLDELSQSNVSYENLQPVMQDIQTFIAKELEVSELYKDVPLKESLALSSAHQHFLSVRLSEDIDEKLYNQVKLYRLKLALMDVLSSIRIEYFALLDGKKSEDYTNHEIQVMKLHKTLNAIEALSPDSPIEQKLVSSFMQEILGGLEKAFPHHISWKAPIKTLLHSETISNQRYRLEKSHYGLQGTQSNTSHQSLGEQIFSLNILLTRIQHGMHDLESTKPDHFSQLSKVTENTELLELRDSDPYKDIGVHITSHAIEDDPYLKALRSLRTMMKNTARKHIAKNKRARLFQFFHRPAHVTKQITMNQMIKKQLKQIGLAYYTLLQYAHINNEPAIRTRYITRSISFLEDLPDNQEMNPTLMFTLFQNIEDGLQEHFQLPWISQERNRLPHNSLGDRLHFLHLVLKTIAHKYDTFHDIKADDLTDLITDKHLSELRERPYSQLTIQHSAQPKNHPLIQSLQKLNKAFIDTTKMRLKVKHVVHMQNFPYSANYHKLNRLYRGKDAKGFDDDGDLPQHAKL